MNPVVVGCQLGERDVGRMFGAPDIDVVQEIWLAVVRGLPSCGDRTDPPHGRSPLPAGR
jgi:hypothetical protein